jgi:PEGA domain-containing protein
MRLLLALLLGLSPLTARGEGEVRRRVAVLEFRGGVERAPDLGSAIAKRMQKTAALDVIDPQEARRRAVDVDAEVARCAGDPDCTARVGGRLDVDEVLLVAMSQLGAVVLSLQRVDVLSGKATGSPVSAVLPATGPGGDDQIDGWLRQLYPPTVFKRYGYLSIRARVDGAVVKLNGLVQGETPLEGRIKLAAPKAYIVTVTKPGRVSSSARIDVVPDGTVEWTAELPEAEGPLPWYKRWYTWAIAGAVAAAAVGAGVGLYFGQGDDSRSSTVFHTPPAPH